MRRAFLTLATLAVLVAASASPAHAAVFPGDAIDGPSPDVQSLGGLDLARDGTGALAYVKRADGVDHIFVARFENGAFQPPERVDGGIDTPGSQPVVGVTDRGRLVVVFVSAGIVYGVVRPAGEGFSAPTPLAAGGDPSADMSINGTAFTSFTAAGDVRIARLDRRSNQWAVLPLAADVDPARAAGVGGGRSRVSISADGVGVVTWGEGGHVYARKMFNTHISEFPQDLSPETFEDRVATVADLPDVDAEDDSSYAWVVFRQAFADGTTRILARRQRGTTFDPAVAVDAGGEPLGEPRIEINGRGVGMATTSGAVSGQAMSASIVKDAFLPGARFFAPSVAGGPAAVPALSENNDGLIAGVLGGPGEAPYVRARLYDDSMAEGEFLVSRPELGPVQGALGFDVSSDRASGVVMAWVQGEAGERRIVAGYVDRIPSNFVGNTSQRCCQNGLPRLAWQPSFNLWGALRYEVLVDGQVVGQTSDTFFQLTAPVPGGAHEWQVRATDIRGQQKRSKRRLLRIDDIGPRLSVGYKRTKRVVKLSARASDPARGVSRAAGMERLTVSWGDGTVAPRAAFRLRLSHRYRRRGTYVLEVKAVDRAGNETVSRRTVRVR